MHPAVRLDCRIQVFPRQRPPRRHDGIPVDAPPLMFFAVLDDLLRVKKTILLYACGIALGLRAELAVLRTAAASSIDNRAEGNPVPACFLPNPVRLPGKLRKIRGDHAEALLLPRKSPPGKNLICQFSNLCHFSSIRFPKRPAHRFRLQLLTVSAFLVYILFPLYGRWAKCQLSFYYCLQCQNDSYFLSTGWFRIELRGIPGDEKSPGMPRSLMYFSKNLLE